MQHRYAPMRPVPVASEEEVQAMFARLKHRGSEQKTSHAPQAVQSPKEKSDVKLEWERPTKDAMAIKTKCGRYSCCKVTLNGKLTYELWRLTPGGAWFSQLHKGLDNFLQAQELARQDAEKRE